MKLLTLSFGLLASAFVGLGATPVAAQELVPKLSGDRCPDGYTSRSMTRYGEAPDPMCKKQVSNGGTVAATGTALRKANARDRCPIAYFTDGAFCSSVAPNPPTVRLKGSGSCRAGEVEDWGIYCVSNYARLERRHAAVAIRDWNTIYSSSGGQSPNQPTPPEGDEYSPAYIAIFGRVKMDGTPFAGGAAPAAAAATPASTGPSRTSGTLNPQLRTDASFLCAEGWVSGLAGTRNGNANMCYPNRGATPAFPRQSSAETCPSGYVLSSTWCVQGSNGMPGQTAAQATPTNCPAPAGNAQAGAQLGAQLGGLFGGRRGNSQAASALGGLLGAAAGQAARPAGCP
jgi:hypothetical protein